MWIVYRQGRSIAVADVPLSPLSFGCRDATLTDCLWTHGVTLHLLKVGCHDLLADGVVCCGVVDQEATVMNSFHAVLCVVYQIKRRWSSRPWWRWPMPWGHPAGGTSRWRHPRPGQRQDGRRGPYRSPSRNPTHRRCRMLWVELRCRKSWSFALLHLL